MAPTGRELVVQIHQQAIEKLRCEPAGGGQSERPRAAPDYPPADPASPLAHEWELFRHEVGRLLAEGQRGRYALVKAGAGLSVWETLGDAVQAGHMLYGGNALVQPILPHIPFQRAG